MESVRLFVDAPSFADTLADRDRLETYAAKIDFDAVFGYLKKLAGCARRSELNARVLKMMLPRVSVDHGGDRLDQELVQKVRAASLDSDDICLTLFGEEFRLWQNPPPEVRAQMRAKRRFEQANVAFGVGSDRAWRKEKKRARAEASTVAGEPAAPPAVAPTPVVAAAVGSRDEVLGAADASPDASAELLEPVDQTPATMDKPDGTAPPNDPVDVIVVDSDAETAEAPPAESAETAEAPPAESAETAEAPPADAAATSLPRPGRRRRSRARTYMCTVCSANRPFDHLTSGMLACTTCGNTFANAGLDSTPRRKLVGDRTLVLYYKRVFPGFVDPPVMEMTVTDATDLDDLSTCSRSANCKWVSNLPTAYLHQMQTLNKNVTAVYYNSPHISKNGVNSYKHMCVRHQGKMVEVSTMQKKRGGPGFHHLVSTSK